MGTGIEARPQRSGDDRDDLGLEERGESSAGTWRCSGEFTTGDPVALAQTYGRSVTSTRCGSHPPVISRQRRHGLRPSCHEARRPAAGVVPRVPALA